MAISDRDRRFLIVGGAIAGVLVLGLLLFNLLSGGGGEGSFPLPTASGPIQTPPPVVTPTPSLSPVFSGRDPFSVPPALASLSASPSPGSSTSPSPSSSATTSDGKTVVLVETFVRNGVQKAKVMVDSQTYSVKQGTTFAGSFEVTSLSATCIVIVYGDETLDLCTSVQG